MVYVFILFCWDCLGIVVVVVGLLWEGGGNILEVQQFDDFFQNCFFMCVMFEIVEVVVGDLQVCFFCYVVEYVMDLKLCVQLVCKWVILMVFKFDYCLGDFFYWQWIGEFEMDVVGIILNYFFEILWIVVLGDVLFYYLLVILVIKVEQEVKVKVIIVEFGVDLVVFV